MGVELQFCKMKRVLEINDHAIFILYYGNKQRSPKWEQQQQKMMVADTTEIYTHLVKMVNLMLYAFTTIKIILNK